MSALVIALLYLGLVELLLMESAAVLRSAGRYRARTIARIEAENGAELAAQRMVMSRGGRATAETEDANIEGEYRRLPDGRFELRGRARTAGVPQAVASVRFEGRIVGSAVRIDSSQHSQ